MPCMQEYSDEHTHINIAFGIRLQPDYRPLTESDLHVNSH